MGRWTLGEIRDWSGDSLGGPERVGVPFGGPGRIWGPSGRSGTGRGTHRDVRDGLGDLDGGTGGSPDPSRTFQRTC